MNRRPVPSRLLCLCLPAALLAFGCGPSAPPKYRVNGQVLLNGKPITADPKLGQVKVQLVSVTDDPHKVADPVETNYDQTTGKFVVVGLDQKGAEAGKYRLVVQQFDPYPADKLGDRFGRTTSPVVVEITGPTDLTPVELSKYLK